MGLLRPLRVQAAPPSHKALPPNAWPPPVVSAVGIRGIRYEWPTRWSWRAASAPVPAATP
eukprot:COSAG01_NODE_59810_length_298_cov_0.753769_1_plen_59_part_01